METLLLVINIILAFILVVLVLLQKSEGGALGIGVSQENFMLSRSAGSFITKATAIVATLLAVLLAWAYSMPPIRLKNNGWLGNAACGFSYEGLAWITGAIVVANGKLPSDETIYLAILYSLSAHGIMTLNDFKSIDGDKQFGINSLPVQFGPDKAAKIACWVMATPQLIVVTLMASWGAIEHAIVISCLVAGQFVAMRKLLKDPLKLAPWYNATGVLMFVLGMMVCAFGLRNFGAF